MKKKKNNYHIYENVKRVIFVLKRKRFETPRGFIFRIEKLDVPECYYMGWADAKCNTYEVCGGFKGKDGIFYCKNCTLKNEEIKYESIDKVYCK